MEKRKCPCVDCLVISMCRNHIKSNYERLITFGFGRIESEIRCLMNLSVKCSVLKESLSYKIGGPSIRYMQLYNTSFAKETFKFLVGNDTL